MGYPESSASRSSNGRIPRFSLETRERTIFLRNIRYLRNLRSRATLTPRFGAALCGVIATLQGVIYLAVAGAPKRFLVINVLAGLVALALGSIHSRAERLDAPARDVLLLLLALFLLATALFGQTMAGASRWLTVGTFAFQPAFLAVPILLVSYASSPRPWASVALVIAATALALQPDRSMAGTMTLALTAQALLNPSGRVLGALCISAVAFIATLVQPDDLPAMPYVEDVVFSAFDASPLLGMNIVVGLLLLIAPGAWGFKLSGMQRLPCVVFATVWFGLSIASIVGPYPTPVLGYSGAAVLGYMLSAAALPPIEAAQCARQNNQTA